jgi:hypothetical protein
MLTSSTELERLVGARGLKRESPSRIEYDGLVQSGKARLKDADKETLSFESRFDLAYNAAHALALAALRRLGYRSSNRYLVFQILPLTTGLPASVWRVLSTCHQKRNQSEYEGVVDISGRLLDDLLIAAHAVCDAVSSLPTPKHAASAIEDDSP